MRWLQPITTATFDAAPLPTRQGAAPAAQHATTTADAATTLAAALAAVTALTARTRTAGTRLPPLPSLAARHADV